jgi:hypothetical protein
VRNTLEQLGIYNTSVGIEQLFPSSQKRKRKQSDCVLHNSLDTEGTAELQKLLEMCAGILIGLTIERAGLDHHNGTCPNDHHNETCLNLEVLSSSVDTQPDWDIVSRRSR